jgi:condensin complex subunit 1
MASNPTSVASSAAKSKLPSKNKSRPMEIWNWETQCVKLMRSIANIFALDMFKLWGLSNPDASVFGAVLRVVGLAFSDAPACKGSDFKIEIFRVLTAASGRYGQRDNVLQTCVHAICRNEHVPLVIAELCLYAQDIGADANLAAAAFREITKLDEAELARDTAMSRNAGIFLMEAADRLPNVALMSLSLLLPILEQEAYSMRCAVVHTLARVLVSAVGHSSSEEAIRVRESLLAVLLERCIDVNAFVRARVLQAWVLLAEKKCIPVRRVPAVVTQAVERCKDKTAAVRRSALLLLQALLQFNPYAQILPLNVFIAKAKEAKAVFEACSTANDSHRVSDASASNTAAEAEDAPKASARARMVFYDAAVEFIQQLHTAIAIAIELLGSKNTSDISESVEFIVGCHAYGVDAAAKGVCGLTMLVFSKEETIKSCARSAVVRLFIEPLKSKMMTKEDCRIIIQRMAALAAQCTLGELTSLDATFLDASIAEKGLPKEMLDTIWEWISSPQTSELPVWTLLGCYRLLPILARAVPSQFQSRIDGIVTICGADSQACALSAAQALVQLAQHNGMPRAKTISVCDTLIQVVLREVSGAALDAWFPFAEAACQAIWVLHPRPEALFASAIRSLLATSLGQKKKEGTSASSGRLSQLFFLTGQSAVRGVIRVEYAGKSRAKIADAKENAKHGISSGEADKDDALCKDLGLVPEQARQTEAESARDSAESDLADPENLIAMVSSMAARVAINTNGKYADATLRCAAGQCIGLCSATSSKLAEQNIQLLTSILARASESRLRANAAIALGDIAGRFPNTFEPWASHMFNALRDQACDCTY